MALLEILSKTEIFFDQKLLKILQSVQLFL